MHSVHCLISKSIVILISRVFSYLYSTTGYWCEVMRSNIIWLITANFLFFTVVESSVVHIQDSLLTPDSTQTDHSYDFCMPLVIAHRGASGYVPEHTLGSYALAITLGTDYVEPDLVMTSDGHMIARHDNELGLTTDVAHKPEFADRYRTQDVDGVQVTGWFVEDFNLAEIKTLRAVERVPQYRPGNTRLDLAFEIPTFQEIIDLVKSMEIIQKRKIGLYPEIKHGSHFQQLGLALERPLVDMLHNNGYSGVSAPVCIQSFEINNLKELRNLTDLRLLQLYKSNHSSQPYDQVLEKTSVTYGDMATAEGLLEVAKYANAVGPDKSYVIPRDSQNRLGHPTDFVMNAHTAGLKVHPYTFRSENYYLPEEFRSDNPGDDAIGDLVGEIAAYIETGIDGLFADQPDIPARFKKNCQ